MTGADQVVAAGASTPDEPLEQLAGLVAALDARDLDRALTCVAEDVRLRIDGLGDAVGKDAVADQVRGLLERTSASRFQVHFSAEAQHKARQEVTLGVQRLPPSPQGWIVAKGSATWEVEPATGLVRRGHVAVDRDALVAQWERAAPLPAGSFRSEMALASFDPGEVVRTRVTVLADPPPRRRRRAGAIAAAFAVVAVMGVAAGLLVNEELRTALLSAGGSTDVRAVPAAGTEPTAETAAPPQPSAPATAARPTPSTEPTAASSPTAIQEPGLSSGEGVEAVEEDDGTQVLSLSDQVLFDPGSAILSDEAGAVLGGVADRLDGAEGELVVVGHTDDIGTPADNLELSAARADAVAGVIAGRLGPGPVTIVTSARGASEPVAGNDTADGRAANRRVELRFTPSP